MKNRAAKSLLLILILFVGSAAAQTACDLQGKSAALFFNLQVGMSPAEAQQTIGKPLKIKIKKRGERTVFQNFIKSPAPENLRGVRAVYLRFFDLKLYQIEIFYEPRPDLSTLEEIKNAVARQFDVDVSEWQMTNNRARIECGGVSISADNVLNPRIELTDETIRAQVEESRKK